MQVWRCADFVAWKDVTVAFLAMNYARGARAAG